MKRTRLCCVLLICTLTLVSCQQPGNPHQDPETDTGSVSQTSADTTISTEETELESAILENPGKVFSLCTGHLNPLETTLDVDCDGVPERIALSGSAGTDGSCHYYEDEDANVYPLWEEMTLSIGEAELICDSACYLWQIFAVSPDGKDIWLGLKSANFEDDSTSPSRSDIWLFRYNGTAIQSVFSAIGVDIADKETLITADEITAVRQLTIPFANSVLFTWTRNPDGQYIPFYDGIYDYLEETVTTLHQAIPIYTEIGAGESQVLEPQKIQFLKTDMMLDKARQEFKASSLLLAGGESYMYVRAEDGTEGWIIFADVITTADGGSVSWYILFDLL